MKITLILFLALGFAMISACSANRGPKTELEFANKLARDDLWKEANYRWTKLIAQGKESAAIYNNLAISYEEMGKFKEAGEAYQKALKLSPNNSTINTNYKNFKNMFKKDENEKDKHNKKDWENRK